MGLPPPAQPPRGGFAPTAKGLVVAAPRASVQLFILVSLFSKEVVRRYSNYGKERQGNRPVTWKRENWLVFFSHWWENLGSGNWMVFGWKGCILHV